MLPTQNSGPLAKGRLVCKHETESGYLCLASDTAALPLEEPTGHMAAFGHDQPQAATQ